MTHPHRTAAVGVAASLTGSVLFAVLYYYATLLEALGGARIFGWRVLLTAPFVTALIVLTGKSHEVAELWRRLRARPSLWWAMIASSALVSVQLWLFLWAPVNGYALDVSLGYFLLPLTLALTGRWVFGESLSRWQVFACWLAAAGVLNELLFAPRIAWPAFVVAFAYPVYFSLRRRLRTNNLGGMWLDMMLGAPVGILFLAFTPTAAGAPAGWTLALLVLGLGALSATALACMIAASERLKLGIFGLLTYAEPVLLVFVALALGERIGAAQWPTYLAIWSAILILAIEGVASLRRGRDGTR